MAVKKGSKSKAVDDSELLVNSRLSSNLEQLLVGMGASLEPEREKDAATLKAEKSFAEFFKQAWPIMEPGVPYIHGWHIDAICEHLEAVSKGEIHKLLINMPPRHSKLCADDTDVLTPDGWMKHGDLRVGDYVYSPEGKQICVIAVAPKSIATHRVTFTDGAYVDVNLEHEWTVYDRTDRKWKTLETVDFVRSRRSKHKPAKLFYGEAGKRGCHYRYQLPWVEAQEFAEVEHKVHPYCLGIWLGDGTATASTITMSQEDAAIVKTEFNRLGVPVGRCWIHATTGVESFSLANGDTTSERHGLFRRWLKDSDLFNNKHIPQEYLFDSIENRKELLAGLLDSDGHMDVAYGRVRYVTTSQCLAEDVVALVRSLGGVATISAHDPQSEEEQRAYYEARGATPIVSRLRVYSVSFVQPFKINSRLKRRQSDVVAKKFRRSVKSVEELAEPKRGNCIHVETADGLYLVGKDLVPTHNSTLVSVAFPAWEWIHRPWMKYLYSSYSGNLSLRDNVACRRLITSSWYQANWGNVFSLSGDQNEKMRFENSRHGVRMATSVGGTTTGEGGDRIVCFPYGAKVLTESGSMLIGDIVEQRREVRVWCLDNDGKPCLREIERWNKNPGREIVRVGFKDGGELECTADHKIKTCDGWLQAQELTLPHRVYMYHHFTGSAIRYGYHTVTTSESVDRDVSHPEYTYCLTVAEYHNFLVETGEDSFIVVSNCDDPHNVKEAESEIVRQGVLDWWHQAMSTRLNDPKRGAYIVVMQRVHDQDLSGSILERGGYEHLCLPCRYEGKRTRWRIGWQDPRKEEGELLWPERFDEQHVSDLEKTLGSYAAAAQLQQRPTPAEGGIFKKQWFRTYDTRPTFIRIIESWDTATSEKELSAYSVCSIWGETIEGNIYLLHIERQRLSFPQLKAQVVALHNRFNGNGILIEDKSSGRQLCQDLGMGTRLPLIPVQIGKGQDKVARAMGCSAMVESGRVYIPVNAPWLSVFMQEVLTFPNTQYKDQVDSMTQALNYMKGGSMVAAMDLS